MARTRYVVHVAVVLALASGLVGCAASGPNPFDEAGGDESVRFTIQNQNFNDATVWALWDGGVRDRLGSVTGNTTQTFTARHRGEAVRFEVDFLAGGDYVTRTISVAPGDEVSLRIAPR